MGYLAITAQSCRLRASGGGQGCGCQDCSGGSCAGKCFRADAMGWSCCRVHALEKQLQSRAPGLEQRQRPKPQLQHGTCDELIGACAGSIV